MQSLNSQVAGFLFLDSAFSPVPDAVWQFPSCIYHSDKCGRDGIPKPEVRLLQYSRHQRQGQAFTTSEALRMLPPYHKRNMVADSFVTKSLIHCRQSKFYRNAHVVTDSGRCCSSAAPEPVNGNDVCTAAGDSAGNGCNIVDGCNFYNNWFFIFVSLLQRINQLPQIFNGIDIMVRCRGDGIKSLPESFWCEIRLLQSLPLEDVLQSPVLLPDPF